METRKDIAMFTKDEDFPEKKGEITIKWLTYIQP